MVKKYVKKPIPIEAVQWVGSNIKEIESFVGNSLIIERRGDDVYNLRILTLEGDLNASVGDYIIKGIKGEFYPCKPDVFHNSYEEVK